MEVVAVGALAATAASTIYSKRNSDIQKKQVKSANEGRLKKIMIWKSSKPNWRWPNSGAKI